MTSKGSVAIVGNDPAMSRMFLNNGFALFQDKNERHRADILCFIGGADIDPSLYNQSTNPHAGVHVFKTDDARDTLAFNARGPRQTLVGICRGGQFLNVMSGGSMIQHVSGHTTDHTMQDCVWNKPLQTTSSHHQMMLPSPKGTVFAYSEKVGFGAMGEKGSIQTPDHETEVVYYEHTHSLCYQGHPEWNGDTEGLRYFLKLLDMIRG